MATDAALTPADRALIADNPTLFCRNILRWDPYSRQREILESVRDNSKTAVRSGHAVGKTAVAAAAVLWFLAAHEDSRVITTAPTFRQVTDLLWPEIHRMRNRAPQGIFPRPNAVRLDMTRDWFAVGYSTDEPERFSGHHARHLLLVVDEASGVAEDIYRAAEGFQTAAGARVLLIGNPTQMSGQFYRAFHSESAFWHRIHVSASDSPNFTGEDVHPDVAAALVSREWVDEKREQWGEASPEFAIRCLGDFPSSTATQVLDLRLIEAAQARTVQPRPRNLDEVVLACDIAEFGDDTTVICERVGMVARIVHTAQGQGLDETEGAIMRAVRDLSARGMDATVVVDAIGVGAGMSSNLQRQGVRVQRFKSSNKATDRENYPNMRCEALFHLRDVLPEMDLDRDPRLTADLVAATYKINAKGQRQVEPKADIKSRLGRSPDLADAVAMAFSGGVGTGHSFVYTDWLEGGGGD